MEETAPVVRRPSACHMIPLGRRLAYSVGHVLNDLCASMWFTYLLIYLQAVLLFSNKIAGGLVLLGQIADAISTPFVGYESDRRDDFFLCRYGQRKTWHLIGTICVAATFPFLFMHCLGCSTASQAAQFAYFGAFIIIFQFGWAATQVSHLSLIPDLTPLSTERVELNALRYAMTVMSNICVYGVMWLMLGIHEDSKNNINPNDAGVFQRVSLMMVGIGLLFAIIFHVFVKEKPLRVVDDPLISAYDFEEKPHLHWNDWFRQPQFYMVAVLYMATRLYVNVSQVYIPLYVQESLGLHKDNIAIIPLVIYISSFTSSFIMKFLNITLGNKVTYLIGCFLGLTSCIWIYFGEGQLFNKYEVYAVAVLIGVAGSTLLIISLSFTSDLIANSVSSGAFVFGSMSFTDKLANGLAVIIIQNIHPCENDECCDDCKWYYKDVLVFACGGAILLGFCALAMLWSQNIGMRHNEMNIRNRAASRRYAKIPEEIRTIDDGKPLLMLDEDDS